MFNNQKDLYNKILKHIHPLWGEKIITLTGRPGIGKSFLVQKLIERAKNEYHCPVCYIKGDRFCQERDYYCFKQALNEAASLYEKDKYRGQLLAKGIQGIPYAGGLGEKIFSDKFNDKELQQHSLNHFLDNPEEENLVFQLNYLLNQNHSLIVCDNIQFFDNKSLELLYIFLSSDEWYFEFLKRCQFIIIYTETGDEISPIIKNILTQKASVSYQMDTVKIEDLDDILKKFGLKPSLNGTILNLLYKLSDGHLEVIKHIVSQMNNSQYTPDFKTEHSENILENLISQKLISYGANGRQISELLEYASLIGNTFSNYELSKITEMNKQDFINAIQKSNDMALIVSQDKYSNFTHDIIQLLFHNRANKNIFLYYDKMSQCIKELYPAEYKRRIEIAKELGEFRQAAIFIALLYARQNYAELSSESDYQKILSLYPDINIFIQDMRQAFSYYSRTEYHKAIRILKSIDDFLPVELLAERDILMSISLTKLPEENSRQESARCLSDYSLETLHGEGDLYLRVLLSQISSFSHLGNIAMARKCEAEIYRYLQPRMEYDNNASTVVNILRRKANSMHECIYAERHIRKSVAYFAPLPNQQAPLNPIQYLMSLGNHAGILIECARFGEALAVLKNAHDLIWNNPNIVFPRLQIIDNNYLIATYLLDKSRRADVLNTYKKLVNLSQNADNIFITSNYCALLAANGYIDEAYEKLSELRASIQNYSEQFYEISVSNNLLVLSLFKKRFSEAQILLDELNKHINNIIDESYYKKKFVLFQQVIDSRFEIKQEKIDTFLFDFCPDYQESWQYWGRSFDYTALYYWSDM